MEPHILASFLEGVDDSDFPLENIPFGIVSRKGSDNEKFAATRLGSWVIDLRTMENQGLFTGPHLSPLKGKLFQASFLNEFMGLSRAHWREARHTLQKLFAVESQLKAQPDLLAKLAISLAEVTNHLPANICDYTDFYSSRSHAFNVGSIIRGPANALNENWLHIPIGYHGRSSSIVTSGVPLRRPRGQVKAKDAEIPSFSDCKRLDFEVEVGAFIGGTCNNLGSPIKVNQAWENIFGFVILNDWSFRDFQTWEYVPLGPFTAKNGMSTISPWIVTVDALEGCEVELCKQQPEPLEYLRENKHISFDIELEVGLKTSKMEHHASIVTTNFKYLYWSCTQQLAHHSVSGCNMRPGDLLGSGTISGEGKHEFGSLLQLSWGGTTSIALPNGENRKFLEDGDSVRITGLAKRGNRRIGFGQCEGTVLPVLPLDSYY